MAGGLPTVSALAGRRQLETLVADLRGLLRLEQGRGIAAHGGDSGQAHRAEHAGYDGHQRCNGSQVPAAVDTLGHLLALHVTPASAQDRAQVETLAAQIQDVTGDPVEGAYVDQGSTGEQPTADAAAHGIPLEVVTLPAGDGPTRGFV